MELPAVLGTFVTDCRAAVTSMNARAALSALVRDLVADAEALATVMPSLDNQPLEVTPDGLELGKELMLHEADNLTVILLDTHAGVIQPPHDHHMTAIIGVFEGAEEQRYFVHSDDGVRPAPGQVLEAGDTVVLGPKSIHAISSPEGRPARAIHVYMGPIYSVERSLYDPDTLEAMPLETDVYHRYCRRS